MATVTRRDLARALKEATGGTITDNDAWIVSFIDILSQKISQEGRVEIRGFGAFSLNTISAHSTVDPNTNEKREIPETYTVDFRPSRLYKERIKKDQAKKKKPKRRKASKKSK